jgi:N-lysine methyltransferase SETD6
LADIIAVALQDIHPNEELFAIPRGIVLTTSTSSIPQDTLEPLKESGAWLPLIVAIIYEYLKGEGSSWCPYFRVLPTNFDSLMFWDDTELEQLQASAAVNRIGKSSAEESWNQTIIPLMLQRPDLFPLNSESPTAKTKELVQLAHFAGSLIMAYAFDIDRDNEDKVDDDDEFEEDDEDDPLKGMVPFADMLNANGEMNNVCFAASALLNNLTSTGSSFPGR